MELVGVLAWFDTGSSDRAPQPVQVLGRLAGGAGAGQRERIDHLVRTILDFHATFFGMPVSARIAVVPAEEVPGSARGALLGIRSVRAFGLAGQEEPDDVMLGSRLASLWWGTGCRITGPAGRELEAALRAVAGMMWADYVDGAYRANVLRDWEQNAARAHPGLVERSTGLVPARIARALESPAVGCGTPGHGARSRAQTADRALLGRVYARERWSFRPAPRGRSRAVSPPPGDGTVHPDRLGRGDGAWPKREAVCSGLPGASTWEDIQNRYGFSVRAVG